MNESSNISTDKAGFLKICLFFLGLIVLIIVTMGAFILTFRTGDLRLLKAEESYRRGEISSTIAERADLFNSALALFLELNEEYHPVFGSGKLAYNIGNTYFQLGEYPLSILYYVRAERLMPRSKSVQNNLELVRDKLGLKEQENRSLFDFILLEPFLSFPERLQLFFVLAFVSLLTASAWLWEKKQWVGRIAILCLSLTVLMLINLGVSYYFSPLEAILVHAVEPRREAGMEYTKVGDRPISGGTILEVVGASNDGKWLKVAVIDDEFGYIPGNALKLISGMP